MIGDFTVFSSGNVTGGLSSGKEHDSLTASLFDSTVRACYLSEDGEDVCRLLVEVKNGDVLVHRRHDTEALRLLKRLFAFLAAT